METVGTYRNRKQEAAVGLLSTWWATASSIVMMELRANHLPCVSMGTLVGDLNMNIFTNKDYQPLADEIIKDSFYADNSYAGKIAAERRFAELIVRKVLNLPLGSQMMLGEKQIRNRIALLPHHVFLENAIRGLKLYGNVNSHTYGTTSATESDYNKATESLLDMYAYLPIKYFHKYRFGSRNDVMSAFSLLPPAIRFKALDYLYSVDQQNIAVIDKLVLVIMKSKGSDKAYEWVEDHKAELEKLKPISENAYKDIVEKQGEEMAKLIAESGPKNMYKLCVGKVDQLGDQIDDQGSMYETFEEALPYYKENGHINEGSMEIKEFNDMMEFLYLGRNEDIIELDEPYLVINMV